MDEPTSLPPRPPSAGVVSPDCHQLIPVDDLRIMATPSMRKWSNVEDTRASSHLGIFRQELYGAHMTNYHVVDFVHVVWEVDFETIERICQPDTPYELPVSDVVSYRQKCSTGPEKDLYPVFITITQFILRAVAARLGAPVGSLLDLLWEEEGQYVIVNPAGVPRKPDMLVLTKPLVVKPTWIVARNPGEFKNKEDTAPSPDSPSQPKSLATTLDRIKYHRSKQEFQRKAKSMSDYRQTRIVPIFKPLPPLSEAPSATKRKRADNDDEGGRLPEDKAPGSKKQHVGIPAIKPINAAQAQLTSYMAECLASSDRFYNVGFSLDGAEMTLTYVDRMVAVTTEAFNFLDDPTTFALVMWAMHTCSLKQAGFNPFLHPCSRLTRGFKDMPSIIHQPLTKMHGAFFEFPVRPQSKLRDNDGVLFPPIPTATSPEAYKYCSFKILGTLCYPTGLTGRCTGVYKVRATIPGSRKSRQLALKVFWPIDIEHREPEALIIEHLVEKLPRYRDHLPSVVFSDVYKDKDLDLPSQKMDFDRTRLFNLEERAFHIIASELYCKLHTVKSVAEFKKVWLDCIKCHHAAWEEGRVLHRDLSENNVMFTRTVRDGVEVVIGVVNDWDMASRLNEGENQIPRSAAQHRTGTMPFMAGELLVDCPPHHRYRHDLESFFYILLRASVAYDIEGNTDAVETIGEKKLADPFVDLPVDPKEEATGSEDICLEDGPLDDPAQDPAQEDPHEDPALEGPAPPATAPGAGTPAEPSASDSANPPALVEDPLKGWFSDDMADVRRFKATLFNEADYYDMVVERMKPAWKALQVDWIHPLFKLFKKASRARADAFDDEKSRIRRLELKGKVSIVKQKEDAAKFTKRLDKELDVIINFESFMGAIEEETGEDG